MSGKAAGKAKWVQISRMLTLKDRQAKRRSLFPETTLYTVKSAGLEVIYLSNSDY